MSSDEAQRIFECATAILDMCEDMRELLPTSPYSMSSEQLRIDTYGGQIRMAAIAIRSVIRNGMDQ